MRDGKFVMIKLMDVILGIGKGQRDTLLGQNDFAADT